MWTAVRRGLNNLFLIVDQNGVQGSDTLDDVLPMDGIEDVFVDAGWDVYVDEDVDCGARAVGMPRIAFIQTVKGHGVSFMEHQPCCHSMWLDDEKFKLAEKELSA